MDNPKVSVIITTHNPDNYRYLVEAIHSIADQTYSHIETLLVVDNNAKFYKLLTKRLSNLNNIKVKILLNNRDRGLSSTRNFGILHASGDIICFMDDDAVADRLWIEEMVKTYINHPAAYGVGGPILPLGEIPWWLPNDFYWLVGVTPKSLHTNNISRIRNTFGSNISFRKEVFEKVGLFKKSLGFRVTNLLQAEEAEMCIRCMKKLNCEILYNPRAIVYHRIFPQRLRFSYLFRRTFNQGFSKAILISMYKDSSVLNMEYTYLSTILKNTISSILSMKGMVHALLSITFTAIVGLGFLYGRIFHV